VFLVAVPVMLMLLVLGPKLLPEYSDANAGTLDLKSVAMSLLSVLMLVYGFKHIAEHGIAWTTAALVMAGLGVGVLFVRRQGQLAYPLLDLALFRVPAFSAAITAYGLSCLAMFGVYIFIAQYLQGVLELSPLKAGLATVPWALAFVAGSLLAPRLARRLAPVSILVWGLVAAAVGFGLLTLVEGVHGLMVIVGSTVLMGLGLAPVFTIGNDMIIGAAPAERAGAASAIAETASEFCGALGIAVFGSVGLALYRHSLAAHMPGSTPEAVSSAAMATIGGAVTAANALPAPVGEALLTASRAAFGNALQVTAVLGALVLLAASAMSARILRTARPRSTPSDAVALASRSAVKPRGKDKCRPQTRGKPI
jgi:MFS transporter, DHA2 family, multidrug resistance protein